MKKIIILTAFVFMTMLSNSQSNKKYAATVHFYSVCCGVPDSKPLFDKIIAFKKLNKIKVISYDNIGPLGKEGEYMMGFNLKELNKKQKILFIEMLNKEVPLLKLAATDPNSAGNAEVVLDEEKMTKADLGRATLTVKKI